MSRQSTTVEKVTCDGCGRESSSSSSGPKGWRQVELVLRRLDGEQLRSGSVDLCPACLDRCEVPGLDARSPR